MCNTHLQDTRYKQLQQAAQDSGRVAVATVRPIADAVVTQHQEDNVLSIIEDAGVQTQIKTGNFIIPVNATDEEVIEIITKPGL